MSIRARVEEFCRRFGIKVPVLLAPMAGVPAPALSIAVANAGGLGACGALMFNPEEIRSWAGEVRAASNGAFQLNLWVPDPPPVRDPEQEARLRSFLAKFAPEPSPEAGDSRLPDFDSQCEALLEVAPPVVSSVMGLFPPDFVEKLKARNIAWFANVTSLKEALAAQAAGADVIVAQGMEAGGHRGCFETGKAKDQLVGLFSLVPALADALKIPVVAAGGIADGRGVAAALALGASAVTIGTGFLRSPEANIHPAWAEALGRTAPEDTVISTVFSGRAGRSLATAYVRAATAADAPPPAPYPVQRGLTAAMRAYAASSSNLELMQAWAGQSAGLASTKPAGEIVRDLWAEARTLLDNLG